LSMCQLHISLTRAAQIYLELHFCVELHTKKALGYIPISPPRVATPLVFLTNRNVYVEK